METNYVCQLSIKKLKIASLWKGYWIRICFPHQINFKGIFQRILRGVETRLIWSMLANWRPALFSFWILKGHHRKRSKKHFQRLKDLWDGFVWSNRLYFPAFFSVSGIWLIGISSIPVYDNPLSLLPRRMALPSHVRASCLQPRITWA